MVGYNDELMIVEMDLMHTTPYVIDFGKVKIDRPPDFPETVLEYQEREGQERFGENWGESQMSARRFRKLSDLLS